MNLVKAALNLPRASEFLGIKPTDGIKQNNTFMPYIVLKRFMYKNKNLKINVLRSKTNLWQKKRSDNNYANPKHDL
jgi:hypothetical protein